MLRRNLLKCGIASLFLGGPKISKSNDREWIELPKEIEFKGLRVMIKSIFYDVKGSSDDCRAYHPIICSNHRDWFYIPFFGFNKDGSIKSRRDKTEYAPLKTEWIIKQIKKSLEFEEYDRSNIVYCAVSFSSMFKNQIAIVTGTSPIFAKSVNVVVSER